MLHFEIETRSDHHYTRMLSHSPYEATPGPNQQEV